MMCIEVGDIAINVNHMTKAQSQYTFLTWPIFQFNLLTNFNYFNHYQLMRDILYRYTVK